MIFVPALFVILLIIIVFLSIQCVSQTRRLEEIRRVINAMNEGDYSSRMGLSFSDRIGDVVRNINDLAKGTQTRLQELTNEKDKLQAILSNMAEGVLVIGADSRLIHLSPSFKSMFETRSEKWQNKFYWEIITNQDINASIREVLNNKKILSKEITLVRLQEMFFNMQISPVIDSNGGLVSLVAVFHDVTELKKFERLRSEFVANVSHELKTPLTSIRGFVETLHNGAIDDKVQGRRFLEIIFKQTQRLENLVNDLLVLSSLESKGIKMNFVKGDLVALIQSIVVMKKKQIDDFNHTLNLTMPSNLPLIKMDSQRMEQVFINLLDNAIKFTPPGGKIEIKVTPEDQYFRIDVIDNGVGISSEYLNRIFERFFRVDKSRSQATGGTGLGLSIVKHIVELHGGRISVSSMLGKGSAFSVFLPQDMI